MPTSTEETVKAFSPHMSETRRPKSESSEVLGGLTVISTALSGQAEPTERTRNQKLIKEIKDLKYAIDESSLVAITDHRGRIKYVNDKFCETSKFDRSELLGQDHRLVSSGRHTKEFINELWNTIRQGKTWRGDIENRAKDGTIFWVDTTIVPLLDANNEPYQYISIRFDITERKRVDLALLAATERELAVIRNALDVICTIDAEGNFASMNPASARMWGYEPKELIGRSYLALVVADDVEKTIESAASNMSGRELTDFENRYTHKDGSIISLMWTSHWSESEQLMFSVAHDITARKRAEDELSNFAIQLKRSNAELQDFASVAAHDLQEPLRKIQAFGERLREECGDGLTDDGLRYLERMQDAAGRMQTLIKDLMTFARVTITAKPFEPVDLQLIAEGVLSDLETRIESTNGRVEIGDLGTIDADATQMRQLIQNLVGNALKFGRAGVPPVVKVSGRVELNRPSPDGLGGTYDNYKLTVEDNGIGFEPKYVDRIFKVFQRLHGRTEYEGTGIGLAVCRKITERHGGTISVDSVPDQGTIFTVDLPVNHEEEIINEYF